MEMNHMNSPCLLFLGSTARALILTIAVCLLPIPVGAFLHPRPALAETAPAAQPGGDAAQLLEKHCLNCHVIERITHYRKSKEQWEQTITNMINNDGVVMTEPEKAALVDYFVGLKRSTEKTP